MHRGKRYHVSQGARSSVLQLTKVGKRQEGACWVAGGQIIKNPESGISDWEFSSVNDEDPFRISGHLIRLVYIKFLCCAMKIHIRSKKALEARQADKKCHQKS